MKKVYLVDIYRSNGSCYTYKGVFRSKETAEKFASLCEQETKIYEVYLVSMQDI